MNDVRVESLRNVAILGARAAGKTALTEAILFAAGATSLLGSTDEGTSASDFEPEEMHRRMSVSTSVFTFPWNQHAVTLLDTPGSVNLQGEALAALQAVDGVVVVLSPSNGIIRTEFKKLWARLRERGLPCLVFVNESEKDPAVLEDILTLCQEHLGVSPIPMSLLTGAGVVHEGVIDVAAGVMIRSGPTQAKWSSESVPDSHEPSVEEARKRIEEVAAESSDDLLERYLSEGRLAPEDVATGLRTGVSRGAVVPLYLGNALHNVGIVPLLNAIVTLLPSPRDRVTSDADTGNSGPGLLQKEARADAPFSGLIFKTLIDPFVGRLSYVRIVSGALQGDTAVYNASRKVKEKSGHLYRLLGKRHSVVESARAGDIVAIGKLKDSQTGDTLSDERAPHCYSWPALPRPVFSFAVEPRSSADIDKVSLGLHKLIEEDPTLEFSRNVETKEMVLSGMGQLHLDLALEKLHRKYGAEVVIHTPRIPYRETVKTPAQAQGKYKKQTGGHGQYGDCWLEIAPLPRGGGFQFHSKVVGGAIPRNFIPAVEKGVIEAMHHGVLAGFPVVDLQVAVYDGSYHVVDSSEMSFKIAGSMAFKKAMETAHPVLLEPMMLLEVDAPAAHIGPVIGDLNSRRGRIVQVEANGQAELVKAIVPMAEIMSYTTALNALTGGAGSYTMDFSGYEEVPREMTQRIISEQRAVQQTVGTH